MNPKQYFFKGLPGCVRRQRARSTKTMVGLYQAQQSGLESDPDIHWMTVCEDHGGCVGHDSLRNAIFYLSHPEDWCPTCQEQGS